MGVAGLARTPGWATILMVAATLTFAVVPTLNYYAHGWENPLLLNGVARLTFSVGILLFLALSFPPLFSRAGLQAAAHTVWRERRLLALVLLTTVDIVLFSLSYRYVDISLSTAITAMTPAANVVVLSLMTTGWITWRQGGALLLAAAGVLLVMWSEGVAIEADGHWWHVFIGTALAVGAVVSGGLVVSSLRLGENLAVDWYWAGVGDGPVLVWYGSMLVLALAQGVTAPFFLLLSIPQGMPSATEIGLMVLMGLAVLAGTTLWTMANGSGLRPVVNGLGYLQPGWSLLILAGLGISGVVHWPLLGLGLALIVAANAAMHHWSWPK